MGSLAGILAADLSAAVVGPYGALVGAVAVIAWGARDRVRTQTRNDAMVERLVVERDKALARGDALADRLIQSGERLVPLAEQMKPVLEANTRALEASRR